MPKNEAFDIQDNKPYVTVQTHSLYLVTTMAGDYYE